MTILDTPSYEFFKNNEPDDWDFIEFSAFTTRGFRRGPSRDALLNRFRQLLRNIARSDDPTDAFNGAAATLSLLRLTILLEEQEEGDEMEEDDVVVPDEIEEINDDDVNDSTYEPSPSPVRFGERLNYRRYYLSFEEYEGPPEVLNILRMDRILGYEDRLRLSSINYHAICPNHMKLLHYIFPDEVYDMFHRFGRCVRTGEPLFLTQVTTNTPPNEIDYIKINFAAFLTTLSEHLKRRQAGQQSEIDFTVNCVSCVFEAIFSVTDNLHIAWEKTSIAIEQTRGRRITTDLLIFSHQLEIGCGEIKPPGTTEALLEEDRARVAEVMKKQLNLRIRRAKLVNEFTTFGFFFSGTDIELYRMDFCRDLGYNLYLLDKLILPTLRNTYEYLPTTMELLFRFKESMRLTITPNNPIYENAPPIYPDHQDRLARTTTFLDE